MNYLKRSIFYNLGKYIVKFILIILIALLFIIFGGSFDLTKLLHIDNVHAVTPGYWYYANEMRLYPSIIMNGNSVVDNGSVFTFTQNDYTITYIGFSQNSNGNRLVFQQNLMLGEVAYQVDIYTCGNVPTFRDDFKVGTSSSNVQSVGSLYHTRLPLGQASNSSSWLSGNCYLDSYYVNNNNSGNFSSILLNGSSGSWSLLGYNIKPVGMTNTFYGNIRDTINNHTDSAIINANSNQNVKIENAFSNQNVKIENGLSNQNVKIENAFNSQTSTILNNANSNQNIISSNATSNTQELISNNNSNFNQLNSNMTDDSLDVNTGNDFFDSSEFTRFENIGFNSIFNMLFDFLNNVIEDDGVCHPLEFPLPIIHNVVSLPCMSTIYTTHFNALYGLIKLILNGVIHYYCFWTIYMTIYRALNPMNDLLFTEF